MPAVDHSTLSSYETTDVEHADLRATIAWDEKVFKGSVSYTLTSTKPRVTLDTSFLTVSSVEWNNNPVKYHLGTRTEPRGTPLNIDDIPENEKGILKVQFSTTEKCTGLQWLGPEQTQGGRAPFLFSQCEPIHARSILPCFDTPSVKVPMHMEIESKYPVLVSGVRVKDNVFEQKVPIPAYLFAIASGDLVARPVGPRSHVWAEPEMIDACQWEFENDTEKQLAAAEKLVFAYEWGTYDILVLPPSFPFGGMENPNITFATPTLISGDRTLVNVIAHELAHSWSGNLVSNSSWAHFWLNEGWTVYIERRILGMLHGEPYRHFSAIEGWQDLENAVKNMPREYTSLVMPVSENVDPDDTFSTIPYEKGSTFLWYLENLVGREAWDKFIPSYFSKFKYRSLDSEMFKSTLYEHFPKEVLDKVDWELWLHTPGLPAKPDFDTTLADPCEELADKWASRENITKGLWKEWASKSDIEGWNPLQMIVFLNILADKIEGVREPGLPDMTAALGDLYEIKTSRNAEIKFRWLRLAITSRVESEYTVLADWLGTVGRMKFVRPGYRMLKEVDAELALSTFEKNRFFYHAICRAMVEKDLQK